MSSIYSTVVTSSRYRCMINKRLEKKSYISSPGFTRVDPQVDRLLTKFTVDFLMLTLSLSTWDRRTKPSPRLHGYSVFFPVIVIVYCLNRGHYCAGATQCSFCDSVYVFLLHGC